MRAWAMVTTALATKVAAARAESQLNTSFCECVTWSVTVFLTKLRVGSVAGSGLPPGPVVVGLVTLELLLDERMLRAVKAARKKNSRRMGYAYCTTVTMRRRTTACSQRASLAPASEKDVWYMTQRGSPLRCYANPSTLTGSEGRVWW
jgi:hypothetical protein